MMPSYIKVFSPEKPANISNARVLGIVDKSDYAKKSESDNIDVIVDRNPSESVGGSSRLLAASMPPVEKNAMHMEVVAMQHADGADHEKEEDKATSNTFLNTSVISDTTNTSADEGQEGENEIMLSGMATSKIQRTVVFGDVQSKSNAPPRYIPLPHNMLDDKANKVPAQTLPFQPQPGRNADAQPTYSPSLERLSEYRIDKASSINDLESIRRRLLLLLDRVNVRLREKRVKESLIQCFSGSFSSENIKDLSMQDLIDRFSQDADTSTSSNDVENSKRTVSEVSKSAETDSSSGKRQCTICPLCFEKTATSLSSSVGSCEVCDQGGLCNRCYSQCSSCCRLTCADCLLSCGDCGLRYHCSDCVIFGEGKCVICRKWHGCDDTRENVPIHNASMVPMPGSSQATQIMAGSLQSKPSPKVVPSSSRTVATPPQPIEQAIPVFHPKRLFPLPPVVHTKASVPSSSQLFSIHRFLITESEKIGIIITSINSNRQCLITTILPNSVASHHGVEVNDEIIVPEPASETRYRNVYSLFVNASKQRPLIFEVKRAFKSSTSPKNLALGGPHSLHRFIITESGRLGITLKEKDGEKSIVSTVEPNSLGDIYGIRKNDIICKPLQSFTESTGSSNRPLTLEVWRVVSNTAAEGSRSLPNLEGYSIENPFIFTFPKLRNDETEEKVAEYKQESDVPPPCKRVNVDSEIIIIDDDDENEAA